MLGQTTFLLLVSVAWAADVDGGTNSWLEWSTCSVSCGHGYHVRSRICDNPEQEGNGIKCIDSDHETKNCNMIHCPVDGFWGSWDAWNPCSVTCGVGIKFRKRHCDSPAPAYNGTDCVGSSLSFLQCQQVNCPIDGAWSPWGAFGACSSTCGYNAYKERNRTCSQPAPAYGGQDCNGTDINSTPCTFIDCKDGTWEEWAEWGACSATCGTTVKFRFRDCTFSARNGSCAGDEYMSGICSTPCPVDGAWSQWLPWAACTVTCETGVTNRTRLCSNPAPANGGKTCEGIKYETKSCTVTTTCPIDGEWGSWNAWSDCDKTCGDGVSFRLRKCDNPPPMYNGSLCAGKNIDIELCNSNTCSVDGGWSSWYPWSECSITCGNGTATRVRTCNNPKPVAGGAFCDGEYEEFKNCSINPDITNCTIDDGWGSWGSWGPWGGCIVTCGNGTMERMRECNNHRSHGEGKQCNGTSIDYHSCDSPTHCPMDGGWSSWHPWNECSITCGYGTATRVRTCNNPKPVAGGAFCDGEYEEFKNCSINPDITNCTIDDGWGSWGPWGGCQVSCGNGTMERMRVCNNHRSHGEGKQCSGTSIEYQPCDSPTHCPMDGGWSSWYPWSDCSITCGNGTATRVRTCNNPKPVAGGAFCDGEYEEFKNCSINPDITNCTIDDGWGFWGPWGGCQVTCGNGTMERMRVCNNHRSHGEGKQCSGTSIEYQPCDSPTHCPMDGGWSSWYPWSECSITCGNGTATRVRTCNNPKPVAGGAFCDGEYEEFKNCSINPDITNCTIDDGWGFWGPWGGCLVTCGNGTMERMRVCNNHRSHGEGKQCSGTSIEYHPCDSQTHCPMDGGWSSWYPWSECSITCGNGTATRVRTCNNPKPVAGGAFCDGEYEEFKNCSINPDIKNCTIDDGWGSWGPWGGCQVTCGNSTMERMRECSNPRPHGEGKQCSGTSIEYHPCDSPTHCPMDGGWSSWYPWSECSITCGNGTATRVRTCNNPKPVAGGAFCDGEYEEFKNCSINPDITNCTIDDGLGSWGPWGGCLVTCGNGTMERMRECKNHRSHGESNQCSGTSMEYHPCVSPTHCPMDGGWSSWYPWSECSITCGNGTATRVRTCNNPKPVAGGAFCVGEYEEFKNCSINPDITNCTSKSN
ncbi:SCO-spondin-like isoform X4 [Dreissena polymorpha]|uniref:SCO-spondin-like isoform X4 n=1 Tax=Dreissena polymorpha TaxID=45954 RepID=UPI0022650D82|nr:SCO-spondin-like isoform X4 [Dreissena polymorpha]